MYDDLKHLADMDGIILRRDILTAGGTDRTIAGALRAKVITRIRNGAYALCAVWDTYDNKQRYLARVRVTYEASQVTVVVSHVSAAMLLGAPVWDIPLDDVHVTRTDGRAGRKAAGVDQHRGLLRRDDVLLVSGMNTTSHTRTALDLTTVTDLERSTPVLDHFLHTKSTNKGELRKGAEAMRYWANTLGTDLAIEFADGRRESIGESRTAVMMRGGGFPMPEPNYKIRDEHGNVLFRVDFAWPELGVFLEFDGKVKYQKYLKAGEDALTAVLREKKREERICLMTGWRCIRLTWFDLATPAATRRHIKSVLAGGPVHL